MPKKPPRKTTLKVLKEGGIDPDLALDRSVDQNNKVIISPRLSVPASIRYVHGKEEDLMKRVPERIPQLVADYFGFSLQPFHKEILKRLFEGGKHDIMLPTEHAKSTLCNVVFPVLSLMNDPNMAHIICCVNVREARRWLATVERELTSNEELIRDYPWLKKPESTHGRLWSRTELTISGRSDRSNANPSIVAMGQGAGDIKGRRGKFIGDDLEGTESWSEVERARLYEWMMLEAMRTYEDPNLKPRPLFANVGTPYDPSSIHFRLTREHGFRVFRQPYKYDSGQLIWPLKRDKIQFFRESMDPRQFSIAMRLDPSGGDGEFLSLDQIEANTKAETGLLPPDKVTLVALDPASGSRKRRADYAGLVVLRIEWDYKAPLPSVEVLESHKVRDEAIHQVEQSAQLARTYKCPVLVETNAMQAVYKDLFAHFAPDVKVIPHYTTKHNKTDPKIGITILKTLVREKKLKLVAADWGQRPEGIKTLLREIQDLGTGAHDHCAMALWFGVFYCYQRARTRSLPTVVAPRKAFNSYSGWGGPRLTTTINLRKYRVG